LQAELEPGKTQRLQISLHPWAGVRGRLVGTDGRPLANHKVMPLINGSKYEGELFTPAKATTSDRDGRFELRRIDAASSILLVSSPISAIGAAPMKLKAGETIDVGDVPIDTGNTKVTFGRQ
jgi:hypothetical protein